MLGSIAALLVAGGSLWTVAGGAHQMIAYATMTTTLEARDHAAEGYAPIADSLAATGEAAAVDLAFAQELATIANDPAVRAGARDGLVASADALAALVAQLDDYEPPSEAPEAATFFPAELNAVTEQARQHLAWFAEHTGSAAGLQARLDSGATDVRSAAAAVFASAAELARSFDTENWVATVDHRLEFRRSVDALAEASLDRDGVDALRRYVDAAAALETSNEAELASFAGPLYDNRLAAQAFANSISGGVFLDFDWVPELFGFGGSNGMAGQASLESDGDYFYSRITLTDSVAARWGDGRAESLVAHEVGHAITLKCIDIFTAHAGGDYEAFATAWAIGMGYDTPSNGQAAYGRPSDELIAATMECR